MAAGTTGGVGDSPTRPDGVHKALGGFAYASDLAVPGMLHGATLRSPHPRALIRRVDTGPALALPGVRAVLTHQDVPGAKHYGLITADCPVLAVGEVRHHGEPVAVVAADDAATARRAARAIVVEYDVLEPVTDPRTALFDPASPLVHPGGNLVRHQPVRCGRPDDPGVRALADVVVTREYQVGMQDQAFLGPEAGIAVPGPDGGVELHVATQWLHSDLDQAPRAPVNPYEVARLAPHVGLPRPNFAHDTPRSVARSCDATSKTGASSWAMRGAPFIPRGPWRAASTPSVASEPPVEQRDGSHGRNLRGVGSVGQVRLQGRNRA